jgi:hypothetical protein
MQDLKSYFLQAAAPYASRFPFGAPSTAELIQPIFFLANRIKVTLF